MIHYMEKTWFLWWIFTVVVIVRWFHLLQADELENGDALASEPPPARANSTEFSSAKTESLWV